MAEVLLSTFGESTPLIVDRGPTPSKLDLWRKDNACHALNSISMARAFREDPEDQVRDMHFTEFMEIRALRFGPKVGQIGTK